MKIIQRNKYWQDRLLASDPGRKRLNQASKTVLSLMSSVFTVILILHLAGEPYLTPAIMGGVAGMLGIMTVMDDTKKEKQVTTLLLGIAAVLGVTLGSLLAWSPVLVSLLMILIIFCAFYFSRFGSRYFSLSMIGFMTVYFSSFLGLSPSQFPWFYLAIVIGLAYAFLYNFVIFKDSVQLLRRSVHSFHLQANISFQLLIDTIQDRQISEARMNELASNVTKLKTYASNVSTDLNAQDVRELWPGLTTSQLRLYIFDTAMFVETLADAFQQLKKSEALEKEEVKTILTEVILSLKKARVLSQDYEKEDLIRARKAANRLRHLINDLFNQHNTQSEGSLYLLRRVESIATHVSNGASDVQQAIHEGKRSENKQEEKEQEEKEDDKEKETGLRPTTKKAIQALIAGAIAIVTGYIISPIQPYWVVLTTFIVLLGTVSVGRIYVKGMQRSIGTVIGAVLGFGAAKMVSGHSIIELFLLFAVIFLAFYLFSVSYTAMSLFITMLIAFMYDLLLGGISFALLGARVIDTIAGAAIALAVSAVILPTKTRDKVTETSIEYLEELSVYVTEYIRSFSDPVDIKGLADQAFTLDAKIQAVQDEARPILQWPTTSKNEKLSDWVTVFSAINYYAKHLIASSYQKDFDYPEDLAPVFLSITEKMKNNVETLVNILSDKESPGPLYNLNTEREQIEKLTPNQGKAENELIHHLYYVWKINKSLLRLGKELGIEETN